MAVGYDNIDADAAAAAGVWATNTPGVLHETTADLAFALLLAAARNVVLSDRDTRDGGWRTWSPTAFLGTTTPSAPPSASSAWARSGAPSPAVRGASA